MKGNYKMHVGLMGFAVIFGMVFGTAGALYAFSDSNYVNSIMNSSMNLASFVSHALFGVLAFASGIILVVRLLLDKVVPGKSSLIAKIATILWVIAYIVGVVFFIIINVI